MRPCLRAPTPPHPPVPVAPPRALCCSSAISVASISCYGLVPAGSNRWHHQHAVLASKQAHLDAGRPQPRVAGVAQGPVRGVGVAVIVAPNGDHPVDVLGALGVELPGRGRGQRSGAASRHELWRDASEARHAWKAQQQCGTGALPPHSWDQAGEPAAGGRRRVQGRYCSVPTSACMHACPQPHACMMWCQGQTS